MPSDKHQVRGHIRILDLFRTCSVDATKLPETVTDCARR